MGYNYFAFLITSLKVLIEQQQMFLLWNNLVTDMTNKDNIEEIRRKKMEEMKERVQNQEQTSQDTQREKAERQKEAVLKKMLSEGARKRLNTVQMAKPEFGEEVEQQLLALIQSGRVQEEIDEETMKELLKELSEEDNDDYDIKGMSSRRR